MGVYGGPLSDCFQLTSINSNTISQPTLNLYNYPNPFNPSTTIRFSSELNERVEIEIYNLKGQKIRQFSILDPSNAGQVFKYSIVWDGTDDNNHPVSSGVYFCRLKSNCNVSSIKLLLLK
ncbi:MAG: T9SS type A sorting domain-containing protein [Armatimonadetes bacterium]|nr:T9SS type A sorting domain-containing protein [Armatimonadota bacterium]